MLTMISALFKPKLDVIPPLQSSRQTAPLRKLNVEFSSFHRHSGADIKRRVFLLRFTQYMLAPSEW